MTLSKCAHAEQDHEIGAILQRCDIGEHTLYALGTYGWTAGWMDGSIGTTFMLVAENQRPLVVNVAVVLQMSL